VRFGVVEKLVSLHRVRVLEDVVVVVESGLRGDADDAIDHLAHLGCREPLVTGEEVDSTSVEVDGGLRGEFVAVVLHNDVGRVLAGLRGEGRSPGFELALADIAPGAGDVGPDVDFDGFTHLWHNRNVLASIPVRAWNDAHGDPLGFV
jgi:hypothetical protein